MVIVMVHLHHYPQDGYDLDVIAVSRGYGVVKECNRQHWPNLPTVQTGTRLVKMEVKHPILRNLSIGYRRRPVECDICSYSHVTSDCPLKELFRSCRKEGHVARNCPSGA